MPPTPADQAALIAALIAALREGLGMPTLPVQTLTPEFMKLLGQLVHEATKGTVELLVARAALKREVRAEVTMIVAKENNPLKFSPSVEVALGHLLSPPARGFMPRGGFTGAIVQSLDHGRSCRFSRARLASAKALPISAKVLAQPR